MNDARRELERNIRREIAESSIPDEMKAMFLLATATATMGAVTERRIRNVFGRHGMTARENTILKGFADYCKAQRQAAWLFLNRVDSHIIDATFERERTEGAKEYDAFSEDANELCRLLLLYIDRCASSAEGYSKVFKLLRTLPSTGIFSDDDVARYKLK